jgi:hypothetical protein
MSNRLRAQWVIRPGGFVKLTRVGDNWRMESLYRRHRFPLKSSAMPFGCIIGSLSAFAMSKTFSRSVASRCLRSDSILVPEVWTSHQHTRERERHMRRFKSAAQAHRFLCLHGRVHNLFRVARHHLRANHHRLLAGVSAGCASRFIASIAGRCSTAPIFRFHRVSGRESCRAAFCRGILRKAGTAFEVGNDARA